MPVGCPKSAKSGHWLVVRLAAFRLGCPDYGANQYKAIELECGTLLKTGITVAAVAVKTRSLNSQARSVSKEDSHPLTAPPCPC